MEEQEVKEFLNKLVRVKDVAELHFMLWDVIIENVTAKEFKKIVIEYKKRLEEMRQEKIDGTNEES